MPNDVHGMLEKLVEAGLIDAHGNDVPEPVLEIPKFIESEMKKLNMYDKQASEPSNRSRWH